VCVSAGRHTDLDIGVCVSAGRHTDLDIGVCVSAGRHTDLEDVRTTADQQGGIQILKTCNHSSSCALSGSSSSSVFPMIIAASIIGAA
jgi:hypothetical protein